MKSNQSLEARLYIVICANGTKFPITAANETIARDRAYKFAAYRKTTVKSIQASFEFVTA